MGSTARAASTASPRHHWLAYLVIGTVVAVCEAVFLFVVPVPHPFATSLSSSALGAGTATLTLPSGSAVKRSFSTGSEASAAFGISDGHNGGVYSSDGSSCKFLFTGSVGRYRFTTDSLSPQTVSVSGTNSSTVL